MKVLKKINIKNILFFDIETSTTVKELKLDTPLFDAWEYKSRKKGETDQELIDMYADEAALYAEFGRIVCISVGMVAKEGFRVKTFNNINEGTMITEFYEMLDKFTGDPMLCGHAIKSFDIPYVAQRGMINNIPPHPLFDTSGEKPWTMDWILDTKELWQGTSFNRTSLLGLTTSLGLPSPKQDLQGKDVPKYFWLDPEKNITRISEYCERDVVACYDVIKYLKNLGVKENVPLAKTPLIVDLFEGGDYGADEKKELKEIFDKFSPEEREMGYVVLNSIVSTAKGKRTKITKAHVKSLKESYDK